MYRDGKDLGPNRSASLNFTYNSLDFGLDLFTLVNLIVGLTVANSLNIPYNTGFSSSRSRNREGVFCSSINRLSLSTYVSTGGYDFELRNYITDLSFI
jgi:hypothetical protein